MNDFFNLFASTSFSVVDADYAKVGPEWHSFVASFQYVRLYYIREGEAELTLTTGRQILRAGHLYFIPPFQILSGHCPNHLEHDFIHLIPDVFTEHFFSLLDLCREIRLEPAVADYLFGCVRSHYAGSTTYDRIVTDNSLRLILANFIRNADILSDNGRDLAKFIKVFDHIDRHIGEPIRLSDLADLVFMNKVYFSNLFKKTFGISPQQYIQQKKLDRARLLLSNPSTSISAIASELGLYDPAAFTAFFKKHTGMTPKEFRATLFQ